MVRLISLFVVLLVPNVFAAANGPAAAVAPRTASDAVAPGFLPAPDTRTPRGGRVDPAASRDAAATLDSAGAPARPIGR
ncbi:MAG: hypothetical protein HYR74_01230 [Candidatus Eisenbacteria bacterium]|nr:hypothetical protein [Candidatus Eisenbacteria bacterium]